MANKHVGGEWEEFREASNAELAAQRELAAAQGDPHAVPIEFPVLWDVGAPMPHLLQNDDRAFLFFYLRDTSTEWDGRSTTVVNPAITEPSSLGIVEFKGVCSTRMGAPNDEGIHGHPLFGKGLRAYTAMRVENSPWIKELQAINSVHQGYEPDAWRQYNHFILGFHDSMFECVAKSFAVERRTTTVREALAEICEQLLA